MSEIVGGKLRKNSSTCEYEKIKEILEIFIPEKDKIILLKLASLNRKTKYESIKFISQKEGTPPSTIKYVFKRLKEKELISYNGTVELAEKGLFLIKLLGMSSNGKIFGSRPKDGSSILSIPIEGK